MIGYYGKQSLYEYQSSLWKFIIGLKLFKCLLQTRQKLLLAALLFTRIIVRRDHRNYPFSGGSLSK